MKISFTFLGLALFCFASLTASQEQTPFSIIGSWVATPGSDFSTCCLPNFVQFFNLSGFNNQTAAYFNFFSDGYANNEYCRADTEEDLNVFISYGSGSDIENAPDAEDVYAWYDTMGWYQIILGNDQLNVIDLNNNCTFSMVPMAQGFAQELTQVFPEQQSNLIGTWTPTTQADPTLCCIPQGGFSFYPLSGFDSTIVGFYNYASGQENGAACETEGAGVASNQWVFGSGPDSASDSDNWYSFSVDGDSLTATFQYMDAQLT